MQSLFNIILIISTSFIVMTCKPYKELNPHNQNFDITQFRYEDYKYSKNPNRDVSEVLKTFFPIGTKRSFIEELLVKHETVLTLDSGSFEEFSSLGIVEHNLLKNVKASHYAVYHFKYKKQIISLTPSGGARLSAFYDDDDKLVSMIIDSKFVHQESSDFSKKR